MLFRTRYNVLFRQFRLLTAQAGSIPAAIRLIFENRYIFHHTSRRDEGIPPYRTVNDGFIIMLQISPAATSPDSMHWARAVS